MPPLNEQAIEKYAIELLEAQGYEHRYGPDIAPDGERPLRDGYDEVLLPGRLQAAIARLNPHLPPTTQQQAMTEIRRSGSPDLLKNNQDFHQLLSEGIAVAYRQQGEERHDYCRLLDFTDPTNNEFIAVNQYTVSAGEHNKRPDLILFVNGLPLVVMELKNPASEGATLDSAWRQLQTYQAAIPGLFIYNALLVIADGHEAKAGTVSADMNRFMAWKSADGERQATSVSGLAVLIQGMLNKATLLDLLRHFIVFEEAQAEQSESASDIVQIKISKKLAAYHQYYAVNRAVESTLRAAGFKPNVAANQAMEDPADYGVPGVGTQPAGDRKGGVIWHTQGSGKSLSMLFYTGKIVRALDNPTVLIITDRNDLDDQLFGTFARATALLRQKPVQADDRRHLKELLKVASGGVVFATMQKFQPDVGNVYETLSERSNIVVIADEAHRTQYGFGARNVAAKDEHGRVVGTKTVYGLAKYLRDALPNATYLGFTGTPIESADVNTPAVFGNYVDVYDIAQALADGATVPIYYESRLAKVELSQPGRRLVEELDEELGEEDLSDAQQAKAKWTQLEALIGSEERLAQVAEDIVRHFAARQDAAAGKGMIVTMSRRIAAALYAAIIRLRPAWHDDDLHKGAIKVVMTSAASDGPALAKHHTTKDARKTLARRMKDSADALQLVIVRDMWLTGFDVPPLHTLYIDKPLRGHNLMQATARVNRVYKDKPGGLVVDYLGIAADLKKALSFYADAGGKGEPALAQEQAVRLMQEKREVVAAMYRQPSATGRGLAYEDYFSADTAGKLALILAAEDHILGLEDGRKRYLNEVTALSKAFAIAVPHEQALAAKEEIAFFQAVKARLAKFAAAGAGKTDAELETTIRQVIDQALVAAPVIDVFDAAGIKKPDIAILSDDFLLELKGMQHKNIALEVLKKLLGDEIKGRAKKNLVQSRTLMEMLETAINKYHNQLLTATEVIDELIKLARDIRQQDRQDTDTGLSEAELAFYYAVADNDSAKAVLGRDGLRELAVYLAELVRKNAGLDWTIKRSVKAKLKVLVKRALRRFGYPPDLARLATETVVQQAEMIAESLAA